MKVKEIVGKLKEYNQEAEISVIAHCQKYNFTLSYGDSEGVTKDNCNTVSLYVDKLCNNERGKNDG